MFIFKWFIISAIIYYVTGELQSAIGLGFILTIFDSMIESHEKTVIIQQKA